ncbi:MAG: UDP-N-acetylglucosamine 2-epimerase (non-hydrolyzing), partial [Dehalococcoidales bacterium]|nr:UDP-N-acetylglucosamine 2-epimerase (non-hydrolyzing) [Dehalococcoidales bacterium]
ELQKRETDFFVLHTGQHYSYGLDRVFFEQLNLPQPQYNLGIGSASHATQTGMILAGVEDILQREKPDIVLVEGDTNSVLAGALAAAKLNIKVGHIEAGLRSYDRQMPEEINRILADHCSDYLFAPTDKARAILLGEGIPQETIFVTGNTVVDAVYQNIELASRRAHRNETMVLDSKKYFLVTLHRQENVDNPARFASILKGLKALADSFEIPVIYPIHPHSQRRLEDFNLIPDGLLLIPPLDYLDFLKLEANAKLVLTDSGGVQEESCILRVPCVTLRDNTERPETIEVGANILAGTTPEKILECYQIMLGRSNSWPNPFGDGKASERIIHTIMQNTNG